MSAIPVEGPRIRLRAMTTEDLDVYRGWMRPGAPWKALDGPYYPLPDPAGIERGVDKLRRWIAAGHEPDPWRRVTIADRASDALLGTVNRYWISIETHWPALGITLYDPATWNRGLGFEAMSLWVDVVFAAHPEVVRVDLRTWSGNPGMVRLAEKLGFQLEARFRRARIVGDAHHDGLGFGLLREEWRQTAPGGTR